MSAPINYESDTPLTLPPLCLCCGQETQQTVPLRPVSSPTKSSIALECLSLYFPPLHLVDLLAIVPKESVQVPLCGRCAHDHFLPAPGLWKPLIAFVIFLLAALPFIALGNTILGYGLLAVAVILMVLIARKNQSHEARLLPIKVYRENGRFRYEVWGGPFYEFLQAKQSLELQSPETR